jgi:microcystin degradation protein MlrC
VTRIAVAGLLHETNSFVPGHTDFDYFAIQRDQPPLVRGADVLKWLSNTSYALSGFIAECGAEHELVPLLWASGSAGAVVTRNAFERITGEMVGLLSQALPVDAVYLDLHGAMVTDDFEDAEGELLRRLRAVVGHDVPVVISVDYHANVTPAMVQLTEGLVAYRTYPHVDRRDTGSRAAGVLRTILQRGRPTGRALRKPPFLLPLNAQCTLLEPSKGIIERSMAMEGGDILNVTYAAGFPPADLFFAGPSVVVHAYGQAAADKAADELQRMIALSEAEFAQPMLSPDEGVRRAMQIATTARRPVILADTQDNPGCGGMSDTTGVLEALVRHRAQGAVVGVLCDPLAAAEAHRAGEGARIAIALGGRSGPAGVEPFRAEFVVTRLGSGKLKTTGPSIGGRSVDLGPMALLTIGGVSVVVSSKRMQAQDQAPFRHVGAEPKDQKILVLKSTVHFRADFGPLAEEILVVLAPGFHQVDPTTYPYQRLRPGVRLYPLGPEFVR